MFSCKLGSYWNHALLNDQSNYSIWDSYDRSKHVYTWNIHIYYYDEICMYDEIYIHVWRNLHEIYMYDEIYMHVHEIYTKYTCTCIQRNMHKVYMKDTWNVHEIYTSLMFTCISQGIATHPRQLFSKKNELPWAWLKPTTFCILQADALLPVL